jgi:UDP-glucose 4-epimerase
MSTIATTIVGPAPAELLRRSDVTLRKGRHTLINDRLAPEQAHVRDLLSIRKTLERGGLEHLLVRGDRGRLVIALDQADRKRISRVFAESAPAEPFYAKPLDRDQPATLVSAGLFARGKARVWRLWRPRIDPSGQLRYGAGNGVQIEFWDFGAEEIVAPLENSLMRKRLPRAEAIDDRIELHGVVWPTLQNMFAPHASDVRFDIDMVFSWVDGNDPEFQKRRAERMQGHVIGEGDDHEARFRQIDELRYALRSVYLFAPWVRRIFIATDSPRPAWLAEHPRVTLVRSEEFFARQEDLPTHNSHAVEAQLHRIEGLSEHFLYSNDDMFFGRPVSPDDFFSPGGISKFLEATTRIGLGDTNPSRSGHDNAARVNRRLLRERFGAITTRHLEHSAAPLRRSVIAELEREFPAEFRATAGSPFRAADNISVTNSLYHYYALMTGRAVTNEHSTMLYVDTTSRSGLRRMERMLRQRDLDFFCLNDGSFPEVPAEERMRRVTAFLERYYPIAAPWEVPGVE